jgi:DNA end-binding protein Ku
MPRAVWTGSLSFGLVNIGVRLFPATSPKDVRFHLVDERGQRVRFRRFAPDEPAEPEELVADAGSTSAGRRPPEPNAEREVEYGELMRGYETDDGVVVLDPDEVESVRPAKSRVIDIEDFVDLSDIDPVFFEKSYVVAPQRDSEKPYALLLRAMERAGRAGIGRFVLRTKPHLVAIRPMSGALGLETMFFADEVRDAQVLVTNVDEDDVSRRELQLAQTLIETLKTEWDPTHYADTYREELLRRIAEKAPTKAREPAMAEVASGRAEALLDALKASVEEAKKAKRRTKKRSA